MRNLFLFGADCLEISQNAGEKPAFACSFFPLRWISKPPPAGSVSTIPCSGIGGGDEGRDSVSREA